MKLVIVYSLLIATLLPTVSPWGTIAYYHLNRDYIARVLCENRDKPELHCDGKCFLAKKLKIEQARQDRETTERVQHLPVLQLFCQTYVPFLFSPVWMLLRPARLRANRVAVYTAPLAALLRPPRC